MDIPKLFGSFMSAARRAWIFSQPTTATPVATNDEDVGTGVGEQAGQEAQDGVGARYST
jgi:hypothetical protein